MRKIQLGLFGLIVIVVGMLYWMYKPQGRVSGANSKVEGVYDIEVPEKVSVSDPFSVKLNIDTLGKSINAVGLHLKFDTNRLQILKMDTTNSFCEFYPENRFDNQNGKIDISCGLPSPGFNGRGTIAIITFEPLSVGEARLEMLEESAILLNDGKATNILKQYPLEQILILGNL